MSNLSYSPGFSGLRIAQADQFIKEKGTAGGNFEKWARSGENFEYLRPIFKRKGRGRRKFRKLSAVRRKFWISSLDSKWVTWGYSPDFWGWEYLKPSNNPPNPDLQASKILYQVEFRDDRSRKPPGGQIEKLCHGIFWCFLILYKTKNL